MIIFQKRWDSYEGLFRNEKDMKNACFVIPQIAFAKIGDFLAYFINFMH